MLLVRQASAKVTLVNLVLFGMQIFKARFVFQHVWRNPRHLSSVDGYGCKPRFCTGPLLHFHLEALKANCALVDKRIFIWLRGANFMR